MLQRLLSNLASVEPHQKGKEAATIGGILLEVSPKIVQTISPQKEDSISSPILGDIIPTSAIKWFHYPSE